jgi:periplasmic divalent cation tolerance protein
VKRRKTKQKNGVCVVQTTVSGYGEAQRLSMAMVKSRLAACVHVSRIRSVYRWKGRVESAGEYLLAAKTRVSLAGRLGALIKKLHKYELPELVVTRLDGGSDEYLNWAAEETGSSV